jgi:signal-transduction protein with cAMP-binding, CBS, and nucleotidyltransferase domain
MHVQESPHLGVALGLFGRLREEKRDPKHKGEINLKYSGTLPLVQCIRLLALREGVEETSTLGRIDALHALGVLDKNQQDYLRGAFHHIAALLLRQQVADSRANMNVGYFVQVSDLSERERDMLVDSLKAIADLRKRVHGEFTGEIF